MLVPAPSRLTVPAVRGAEPGSGLSNVPLPQPHMLGIAAGIWLHRVRPWVLPGPRYVHRLVGWPLIAVGTYLIARSLRAAWHVDLAQPDRLVTTGPYAVSRNPMYVGWALLHLGAGVAGASCWIVAAVPAAAGWMHRNVLGEEATLAEDFADEFQRYRAAVPRYLLGWRCVPWNG